MISIRYFNTLALLTGCRDETIDLPDGSALQDLLAHLALTHPPEVARMLFQDQAAWQLSPYLRAFLNGRLLKDEDLAQPLHAGDEVLLFPAVAGG